MFSVNDTVLYGIYGVCRIENIVENKIDGKLVPYYELKPSRDERSTVFVPINNEKLTARMKTILSVDEIHELIRNMPGQDTVWIDSDSERRETYKQIISRGDRSEVIQLIKTLYLRRKLQNEDGKKLRAMDEEFLKGAEKLLYEEFAHVLNLQVKEVGPFIKNELKKS